MSAAVSSVGRTGDWRTGRTPEPESSELMVAGAVGSGLGPTSASCSGAVVVAGSPPWRTTAVSLTAGFSPRCISAAGASSSAADASGFAGGTAPQHGIALPMLRPHAMPQQAKLPRCDPGSSPEKLRSHWRAGEPRQHTQPPRKSSFPAATRVGLSVKAVLRSVRWCQHDGRAGQRALLWEWAARWEVKPSARLRASS